MRAPGEASTDPDLHVSPVQLAARAAGTMSPAELVVVNVHLETCVECREAAGLNKPLEETKPQTQPAALPPTPYKARLLGTLNERYEIKRPIGSGGMGAVYEALDLHLHRLVALKLLRLAPEDPHEREEAAARLIREARAMAVLSHRNVVTVYDVGMHGEQVFVAMQLVDGTTLRGWLADRKRTVPQILEVMRQAGTGLAAAHNAGLVHRDFKPDNVLISRRGTARVTDFGLARRSDLSDSLQTTSDRASGPRVVELETTPTVTRSGAIVGTPAYMAPEQVQGDRFDARADQFSFCVTTWEALFGARPFTGASWSEIYANVVSGNIIEPDDRRVPRLVVRALRRGLSANAADRFESMDKLLAALDEALHGPARRRRYRQWALLFSFGAVAATVTVLFALDRSRDPAPVAAPSSQITATSIAPPALPPPPTPAPVAVEPAPTSGGVVENERYKRDLSTMRGMITKMPAKAAPKPPPKQPEVATTTSPSREAAAPPPVAPDPLLSEARALRTSVGGAPRARGLLSSDLPPAYHSAIDAADRALQAGDAARAKTELEAARSLVTSVVIDNKFIDAKLQRLNEGLGALPAERRAELSGLMREVMAASGRGDHVGANRTLNQIAARLGRGQ